jgi:hypothetical protein
MTVMKKLLTLTVILYSLIFSSVSFGEWTEVGTTKVGDTYYVDLERMRIHNGFKYLWRLSDFLEPTESGLLSASIYTQIDCKEFKMRNLQYVFYKQPMGEGSGKSQTSSDKDWHYPPPRTTNELVVKKVCEK